MAPRGQEATMRSYRRGELRFDVRDSGPADGEVVVCLHGFPQDSTAYDEVTPRLVEAGLRVLAPDQRGYSPGARPEGRSAYVLRELVADVLALLDAAGADSAHVVGHDWGGAVAWALAGRHPDRVTSLTALSTPHPAALQAAALRSTQALRSAYMAFFQLPWLPEKVALAGGGHLLESSLRGSGLPARYARAYVQRMAEPGALRAALAWYRALPASRGYGAGRVRVPTSYLWGRADPFFAPAAAAGTRAWVTGPYVEHRLDDAGHWLPETRPGEVAAAVLRSAGRA
jgi:pimeloyl-ACP methyl ester carboxylesterase